MSDTGQHQERIAELFAKWNVAGVPSERVRRLAGLVADAATMAKAEYSRPGRIDQNVRREAKRLSKLGDAALGAEFLQASVDLRREAQEAAWRLGLETGRLGVTDGRDWSWLRPAIAEVARGASPASPPSVEQQAFAAAIGATIEPAVRRSGPQEEAAKSSLAFDLACVYRELTGKAPGFSNKVTKPAGSFQAFMDALDVLLPLPVGSDRRLAAAVRRWPGERTRFR